MAKRDTPEWRATRLKRTTSKQKQRFRLDEQGLPESPALCVFVDAFWAIHGRNGTVQELATMMGYTLDATRWRLTHLRKAGMDLPTLEEADSQ